jgi:hypothetical protein
MKKSSEQPETNEKKKRGVMEGKRDANENQTKIETQHPG